jgi:hypothetical protein
VKEPKVVAITDRGYGAKEGAATEEGRVNVVGAWNAADVVAVDVD